MPSVMTCDRSTIRRRPQHRGRRTRHSVTPQTISSRSSSGPVRIQPGRRPHRSNPKRPKNASRPASSAASRSSRSSPRSRASRSSSVISRRADPGPGVLRVDQQQLEVTGVLGSAAARAQQRRRRSAGETGWPPPRSPGRCGSRRPARPRGRRPRARTTGGANPTGPPASIDPLPQRDQGDPERVVGRHSAAGTDPVDPVSTGSVRGDRVGRFGPADGAARRSRDAPASVTAPGTTARSPGRRTPASRSRAPG